MNTIVWFRIGFLSITPYGLCIALALAGMYVLSTRTLRYFRTRTAAFQPLDCMLWSIPCGFLCAKLCHWVFSFGEYSFGEALAFWRGGYAMFGAWMGFALGSALYARRNKLRFLDLMDCFAPSLALFVFLERLAEAFTDQGYGKEIDTVFLRRTLFSMTDVYGSARHAVYRLETLSALIALAAVLWFFRASVRRKFRIRGEAIRLTLLLIAAPQVIWESMRDDGYLAYGFVRISQVVCLACVLCLAAYYLLKLLPIRNLRKFLGISLGMLALCTAITVRQEFAVDTDQNLEWNYLIMLFAMGGTTYIIFRLRRLWTDQALKTRKARAAARQRTASISSTPA